MNQLNIFIVSNNKYSKQNIQSKIPIDSPLSRGVRGVYNSISSQSCDNGGLSGMKNIQEKEALAAPQNIHRTWIYLCRRRL